MHTLLAFVLFAIPTIVTQAFDNIQEPVGWAFTQTTVEKGVKTVERFDPSKPESAQWQLITFEGHAPTAADLESYQKRHSRNRGSKQNGGKKTFTAGQMIQDGTLAVVRDTPAETVYTFTPKMGDDDATKQFGDTMTGRLTIRKSAPSVAEIHMYNTKPIAPGMSVHFSKFEMIMRFAPPAPNAKALLTEMHATMKGRILLLKSIDVQSVVTFSDYKFVGR